MKEKTKKIGIATVYTGYNYGSALQAFATKMIIEQLGMTAELLKLRGSLIADRDIRLKKLIAVCLRALFCADGLKKLKSYKNSLSQTLPAETKRLFCSFTEEWLCPKERSYAALKNRAKSDEYEAFICGSDQVWNGSALYVDPFYYLRFAPKDKRIAFAPSFGREFVPDYNKKIISRYVSEIPCKSVRESSGAKIIRDMTGEDVQVLLDPTLILTADEWCETLKIQKRSGKKYLLAYFLNQPSELAVRQIKRIALGYGLQIIGLPYKMENLQWHVAEAGPKEFLEMVSGASFICTDSFHGTAFSLNFQVPFYTFDRNYGEAERQSVRIISILERTGTVDRFQPETVENCMQMEFKEINKKLSEERTQAYAYLSATLQGRLPG